MVAHDHPHGPLSALSRRQFVVGAVVTAAAVASGWRPAVGQGAPAVNILRGSTSQPVVSLTFDAGADRGYAGMILDTLASNGVRASFGVTGRWGEGNGDLVRRMVAEGHRLINHSYSHPSFTGFSTGAGPLSSAARANEVNACEQVLVNLTGVGGKPYFRPPYGDYDNGVLADIGHAGFAYSVMWTLDVLGWKGLSQDQVVSRVQANHGNGYIYLLHVGSQSQEGPALPRIIASLRDRGYGFATVDALIRGTAPPATFQPGQAVRVTTSLRLRTGPGVGYGVIATMPAGTICTVVSGPRAADGYSWYQLDTPYGRGWAAGEFLERSGSGGYPAGTKVRTTAALNLRTAGRLGAGVIATMPAGTVCTVVSGPAPADGYTWYQLDTPYGRGWAAGEYLTRA